MHLVMSLEDLQMHIDVCSVVHASWIPVSPVPLTVLAWLPWPVPVNEAGRSAPLPSIHVPRAAPKTAADVAGYPLLQPSCV